MCLPRRPTLSQQIHKFAWVVTSVTKLYIPSIMQIHSQVLGPKRVKIWPLPLVQLLAFTTALTTVQGMITREN